jgi:serine/threonine protein kinase
MSAIGEALGDRYRIESVLGAGGMATVYRARDLRLQRAVAVKVLSPNLATDATVSRRFEQEARFLAAVSHPSIVSVYDVGEAAGEPFFVMELIDGETLTDRLAREGALAPDEAVPIIGQIAQGLAVLHRGGFVHRDVKPQNILLPRDGPAKLADFGLVRGEQVSDLTAPGTAVGTLAYLAPERLSGDAATPASDVYSLAAVAYEALTGRPPYPVDTLVALVEGQAEPPPLPSSVAPWLTTSFDTPLLRGLAARNRPAVEGFAESLRKAEAKWRSAGALRPGAALDGAGLVRATADSAALTRTQVTATPDSNALTRTQFGLGTTRARERGSPTPLLAWLLALVGAALAVALMATILGALASRPAGTGAAPTPTRSPSPSPTPSARLGTNPVAGVAQAVSTFEQAVESARRGKDGLKGKDADDLRRDAERVAEAARQGDYELARERADALVERVQRLSREMRGDDAARLLDAARRVQRAADALPEQD